MKTSAPKLNPDRDVEPIMFNQQSLMSSDDLQVARPARCGGHGIDNPRGRKELRDWPRLPTNF